MNSDQTSNQTPAGQTAGQAIDQAVENTRPQARDISKTMVDGDDPLDFINKNLARLQPRNNVEPTEVIKEVEDKRAAEAAEDKNYVVPVPDLDLTSSFHDKKQAADLTEPKPTEEPKTEEPEQPVEAEEIGEEQTDSDLEGEGEGDDNKISAAENFKRLRGVVRETKKTLKTKEEELEAVNQKLQQYESGEVFPEVLKEKENRIAHLERCEKLVSLKTSPYYHEAFIKPLTETQEKLVALAKDYEIPEDVINQALSVTNRAELNRFLSSHFDDVGALEAKQLITDIQDIREEALEAEQEPQSSLQKIIQESETLQLERKKQERQTMSRVSKDAWVDSLLNIKEEGIAAELIYKEGDSEYNKKFVDPIISKAATEYGKIVNILAENGLDHLPKELAFALSRMCQLAHASSVALHTRNNAVKHIEELENNVKRTTSYLRPQVGSSNGSGAAASSGPQRTTPQEAADLLINQVLPRS